jgi:hypothetical protein
MAAPSAPIDATTLLHVWERGQGWPPAWQALCVLAAAEPGESFEALAALPVGHRDRRLMELRGRLFGSRLESVVTCPRCGDRLELAFDLADVQVPESEEAPAWQAEAGDEGGPGEWALEDEGWALRFRLPNSADLLAALRGGGRETLLARCVLEARAIDDPRAASPLPPEQLPGPAQAALAERLAELDPQADVRFPLDCPTCGHGWTALFDIASFLWEELTTWALRTLEEVDILARAYGWREADILALSSWRRNYYIRMVTE